MALKMKIKELEKAFNSKGYKIFRRKPVYAHRTKSLFSTAWVLQNKDTEIDEDYGKKKLMLRNKYLLNINENE
jgi:hypothetical protein